MKKNNSGLTQTKVATMAEVPSQVPSKQPSYQAVVGFLSADPDSLEITVIRVLLAATLLALVTFHVCKCRFDLLSKGGI